MNPRLKTVLANLSIASKAFGNEKDESMRNLANVLRQLEDAFKREFLALHDEINELKLESKRTRQSSAEE